jgi:tRNA-dihydrouridine synthase B
MANKFPKLSGKLILAPMHEITNVAFRLMCKNYGASLVSTELLSANALARENKAILDLAFTIPLEKPIACQLFTQNSESMVKAAKIVEKDFDIIDINLGCPSKKIMAQGSGGALLKRKNKIHELVHETNNAVRIPVTVKLRSGIDKNNINAVDIAKICENAGASAITIHARTVEQGYSGKADWNLIKEIKKSVKIPVIGNGDVFTPEDAKKMLEETNCDYIMIGRGAIGNPFIFKQINHFLKTGEIINQTKEEKIKDYFEYIELTKGFDIFSIKDAKLRAQEFTKGLQGSVKLRRELNRIKDYEMILGQLERLKNIR